MRYLRRLNTYTLFFWEIIIPGYTTHAKNVESKGQDLHETF